MPSAAPGRFYLLGFTTSTGLAHRWLRDTFAKSYEELEALAALAPPGAKDALVKRLKDVYDFKNQGWGTGQKFVDPDTVEYCLLSGDADLKKMAAGTLGAMRKLIDGFTLADSGKFYGYLGTEIPW